jgi:putative restriction endonuclease
MKGYVGVTDWGWFSFLRERAKQGLVEEINFWKPSDAPFKALEVGAPFFFRLKAPRNAIGGFGVFARYLSMPDWLAWDSFREGNGAPSLGALRRLLGAYRKDDPSRPAARSIGCIVLTQPVFFEDSNFQASPPDWAGPIVSGKGYDLTRSPGRDLYTSCVQNAHALASAPPLTLRDLPRYGEPTLVRPRLGQGLFRADVMNAYGNACALSGEHSLPVLEAAHIKPFSQEGPHEVHNGLLLRSDLHKLFDNGYLTVDERHKAVVSQRLRQDYNNGVYYYDNIHGRELRPPSNPAQRPAREFLEWHREHCFLG